MSLIYALIAKSNPSQIRYIGKTVSVTAAHRLSKHLYEAKNLDNLSYKCNWIRKVLADGDEVVAITIESDLTEDKAFEREISLIAYYRSLGDLLTNLTDGGEGPSGRTPSPKTRAKISLAGMGNKRGLGYKHTQEQISKRIGITNALGAKHTSEANLKNSLRGMGNKNALGNKSWLGKTLSPETIIKRTATRKANREAKAMALNNQGAEYENRNQ